MGKICLAAQHHQIIDISINRVTTGQGKVWEIQGQVKIREILKKVREVWNFQKRQGNLPLVKEF